MSDQAPIICAACIRYGGADTCTSFPAGIPADIRVFSGDHRTSRAGEPPFELDPTRRELFEQWLRIFGPQG